MGCFAMRSRCLLLALEKGRSRALKPAPEKGKREALLLFALFSLCFQPCQGGIRFSQQRKIRKLVTEPDKGLGDRDLKHAGQRVHGAVHLGVLRPGDPDRPAAAALSHLRALVAAGMGKAWPNPAPRRSRLRYHHRRSRPVPRCRLLVSVSTRLLQGPANHDHSLTMWYPRHMLQKRIAVFYGGATIAGAFSGLLAFGISYMSGIDGLLGWSWIFVSSCGTIFTSNSTVCRSLKASPR